MSVDIADKTESIAAVGKRPFVSALHISVTQATSNLKGLAGLLGALGVLAGSYYVFDSKLGLQPPWPGALLSSALLAFSVVYFLPIWLDLRKQKALELKGVEGELKSPSYFRLAPYEDADEDFFRRPDGASSAVINWFNSNTSKLLYLSGQSGTGKSSLINAVIVPTLRKSGWVVACLRPHDDPLGSIFHELLRPDCIWAKPPIAPATVLELIERGAARVAQGGKRLLIIIDQFEEALILGNGDSKANLVKLLVTLNKEHPIGVIVLLSMRAEYLNDVIDLGLPNPAFGTRENSFEVRPFSRAAAQDFLESSGLRLGKSLVETTLREASEIEDMPDRVRPIVLNMLGLVIASFKGTLPKGVEAGRLLRGYARRCLDAPPVRGISVRILRELITSLGTKRALTTGQIAQAANLTPLAVRGCLVSLANDGLIRRLPSDTAERWEVAHDFVARLIQPIIANWRDTTWKMIIRWALPGSVVLWTFAVCASAAFYPKWHEQLVLGKLRSAGLVPGSLDESGGQSFVQTGRSIDDPGDFWRIAALLRDLPYPITALVIENAEQIKTLKGMPVLPKLRTLVLVHPGIDNFEGMPTLEALNRLDIEGLNHVNNLRGIMAPELTTLEISFCEVKNLDELFVFPKLKRLKVSFCKLDHLGGMPTLPSLEELELSGSRSLLDLSGIPKFPKLRMLNLTSAFHSDEVDLSELQLFPSLKDLNVSYISSKLDIPELQNIKTLHLQDSIDGQQINRLFQNVEELDIYGSRFAYYPEAGIVYSPLITEATSLKNLKIVHIMYATSYDLEMLANKPTIDRIYVDEHVDISNISTKAKGKIAVDNWAR